MIEVFKQALEALKDVGVLTDREWQAVHKNKANELRQAIAELESQDKGYCQACNGASCTAKKGCVALSNPPQRTEPPDWFPAVENILNDPHNQVIQCHNCGQVYTPQRQQEPCPYVVSTKEGTHHCSLSQRQPQYDKTEMNAFVQNLYDQKMREGKHGHYETMFHVVHKAIEQAHGIKGEA